MNSITVNARNLARLVHYYNANANKREFEFRLKEHAGQRFTLVTSYARYLIEYMAQSLGLSFTLDPKTKRITIL